MDWNSPIGAVIPGLEGPVLRALWTAGRGMTSGDLHRAVGDASYAGVRYAVGRLVSQGVVGATRYGRTLVYEANERHLAWPSIEAALENFDPWGELARRTASVVDELVPTEGVRSQVSVAVFGSVARGEAGPDSDIDLLVVVPEDLGYEAVEALGDRLRADVEVWTGNVAQVFQTNQEALREAHRTHDPIVESWLRDAQNLVGPDMQELVRDL